jgi:hypothetical protein
MTTTAGRETPFTLLVALSERGEAVGDLFWDDGEQVALDNYLTTTYTASVTLSSGSSVIGTVRTNTYEEGVSALRVNTIVVMGTGSSMLNTPNVITLNGIVLNTAVATYDAASYVLTFKNLGIKLSESFSFMW